MNHSDHILITVGKHKIGIRGLKSAIEELSDSLKESTDEEVARKLLERIAQTNYIPPSAEEDYKKAILRAFRQYVGRPVEDLPENALQIKVFGPGCPNCDLLTQRVYEVLAEMGKEADVEHVTDVKAIAAAGVLGTPALMVNGKIKASGVVPTKSQIKKWIECH
jgi:small redox-active disulfide protein 2